MTADYSPEYFAEFGDLALSSAEVIVPIVREWVNPKKVIDLGCGPGLWLSVWQKHGCEIQGIDGDWVDRTQLAIPAGKFEQHDFSRAYVPKEKYDLAMSLECAEHLPAECADDFVGALTAAAPVVLFSAAIPHQAGTNHVNCQWPGYWHSLFEKRGYVVIDELRRLLWEDARVAWWYRQNILLYVERERLNSFSQLASLHRPGQNPPSLVHPEMMIALVEWGVEQSRKYWRLAEEVESGRK